MRNTYQNGNETRERILQMCHEWQERDTSPTIQELAYSLNLSITNIAYHLRVLERLGMIERVKYKARGIRLIK